MAWLHGQTDRKQARTEVHPETVSLGRTQLDFLACFGVWGPNEGRKLFVCVCPSTVLCE